MTKRIVLLLLTEEWADWEASYALPNLNSEESGYVVKTISVDTEPKASIGGIRAHIDTTLSDYEAFAQTALLIIPGGFYWKTDIPEHQEVVRFIQKIHQLDIPVAAVCGATLFLARHGFLNTVQHTGDTFSYFQKEEPAYQGHNYFREAQVVVDQGFITANETAAVDFAQALYLLLKIDSETEITKWHTYFSKGLFPSGTKD